MRSRPNKGKIRSREIRAGDGGEEGGGSLGGGGDGSREREDGGRSLGGLGREEG